MRIASGGSWRRYRLAQGGGLLILAALATACGPQVQTTVGATGPLPRPERILVHDFAIHPAEVRLDSGLRGRLTEAFSGDTTTEQQYQAVRETSAAATQALVDTLQAAGIPAERIATAAPPPRGRLLLLEGQVLGIDEGNQTRRRLIGFGSGMSSVEVSAQAWMREPGGGRRLLESFVARADSGHMPGAAGTMGAGALAGRLATAAAVGGVGQVAMTSRGTDIDEARRLGQALAEQVRRYFAQQGWTG